MSRGAQRSLVRTKSIKDPNRYIRAIYNEFADRAFDEEDAPELRGRWREEVYGAGEQVGLDLEIGTGNGFHFAHYASKHPERCVVGVELKYKPLFQALRRADQKGALNACMVRYNAVFVDELFAPEEINNVIIHFPDPWEKRSKQLKHRLIQEEFLKRLFRIQRPGSWVEFKTDSPGYFEWAVERFNESSYAITELTEDMHNSSYNRKNFVTHFEKIFQQKGYPIYYCLLSKPYPAHT